ncbi:MAG: HD domain-containing protein [Candidatus Longimicrobiales bacterium M2_2A_002]
MHPLIDAAADGRLPDWAEATPDRRAHMARVAEVMVGWAEALELEAGTRRRWRAAAMLHDVLRDADPETLRDDVPAELRDLPGGLLHGPAAAERLEAAGVDDGPLLTAVRWHTTGHPDFDRLGKALYVADFTEPGRRHATARPGELRRRAPTAMDAVLREVLAERIGRTLDGGHPLREPTVDFWNAIVGED